MKEFEDILLGVNPLDIRSALYYLGRYLKQAEYYDRYKKNFFDDDYQSKPSKGIEDLTYQLINFIESYEGKKASEFSDDTFLFWVNRINEIEYNLEPEPKKGQIILAESIINDIFESPQKK